MPRQEFDERRRKLVFTRKPGVAVGEFRTSLGQNWGRDVVWRVENINLCD